MDAVGGLVYGLMMVVMVMVMMTAPIHDNEK